MCLRIRDVLPAFESPIKTALASSSSRGPAPEDSGDDGEVTPSGTESILDEGDDPASSVYDFAMAVDRASRVSRDKGDGRGRPDTAE